MTRNTHVCLPFPRSPGEEAHHRAVVAAFVSPSVLGPQVSCLDESVPAIGMPRPGLAEHQEHETEHRAWLREVAAGLEGQRAIVVLEPDAVAFMGEERCTEAGPRQRLLTFATRLLSDAGAWVYLDAGHSGWRSPQEMAPLLKASGIRYRAGSAPTSATSAGPATSWATPGGWPGS